MIRFPLILLLMICADAFGQKITYNYLVDSTDNDTREVMTLFENYLHNRPQDQTENHYWNTDDQQKYLQFDFLESEFQPSLYMGFPVHVLSITFRKEICEIKAQFSSCKADGSPYVLAIVNYIAKKENGSYRLYNALTWNRQDWEQYSVGIVDFYYPDYHKFDHEKAEKLHTFILDLCSHLGVPPKPLEYYLADTYDEIQKLKGLDYYLGMGGQSLPSGRASDNKVYCAGLGEYYIHEVFHAETDSYFPDMHFWAAEGIATFLGGSRGKSLDWHIERTDRYLQSHPETDLNEMLKLTNLDSETSFHYVLGGLIAEMIFEKGGWPLLLELMSGGVHDEDYYHTIEVLLGISKQELNEQIRQELHKRSKD
ncbi:MAG TPA: hypothetical protein DCG24_10780 [Bacteroidetes bacterium]|nr:hypothetical protein [Bacteroidota bacterium]